VIKEQLREGVAVAMPFRCVRAGNEKTRFIEQEMSDPWRILIYLWIVSLPRKKELAAQEFGGY